MRNRQARLEIAVAGGAHEGLLHYQQRPLVAKQPEHPGDGIGFGLRHLQPDRGGRGVGLVPAPQ